MITILCSALAFAIGATYGEHYGRKQERKLVDAERRLAELEARAP